MRNSLLPMHGWKLKQTVRKIRERSRAMKKQWWFRAVESTGLVFGYFWHNANVHAVVARVLG